MWVKAFFACHAVEKSLIAALTAAENSVMYVYVCSLIFCLIALHCDLFERHVA